MKFSEVLIGQLVALVEPMDDERSNEVRCTFYERREGVAVFSVKFLTAYRIRTIQGTINSNTPRFDTGLHRTETEVPAALPVVLASECPWWKNFSQSIRKK